MVEAVALGVDQFDCVLPTRLGRHGTALTAAGKVHVKAARHADEDLPVDPTADARSARATAAGYLRHLFATGEPTASRLLTLHNVAWTLRLLDRAPGRHRRRVVRGRCEPRCCPSGRRPE